MKLELYRRRKTDLSTLGSLFIDHLDHRECFTLEPADCIPDGTYRIGLYLSPRFKMLVPLLIRVPGHDCIEIHPGNFPKDTTGCILVGLNRSPDYVGQSRIAFNRLMNKIRKAMTAGETVDITIKTELYQNGLTECVQKTINNGGLSETEA